PVGAGAVQGGRGGGRGRVALPGGRVGGLLQCGCAGGRGVLRAAPLGTTRRALAQPVARGPREAVGARLGGALAPGVGAGGRGGGGGVGARGGRRTRR